jgi:putative tricarboxylic transport membrane protein
VEHGVRRYFQIASLAFFAVGLFLVFQGRALRVQSQFDTSPGPGFFAFWIGLALATLSLLWLAQVSLRPVEAAPADFVPERAGVFRLGIVLASLAAFALALTTLGFDLTMFAFLLVLLFAFGRDYPLLKVCIALAGSFGVHYVFEALLKVPLPYASIETLRSLGL